MSEPSSTNPTPEPLPCHVITGPLGVGKTTAILHLLAQRRHREFIGVLVNDFGPVGLDAAVLAADQQQDEQGSSAEAPSVVNVPGGCVCCTAAASLYQGLTSLLKDPKLDRVIVEPSGVALPSMIIDSLRMITSLPRPVELRPTVVLADPSRLSPRTVELIPYHRQLLEAADVLVLNHADRAKPEQIQALEDLAEAMDPPKLRILRTQFGQIPQDLLDMRLPKTKQPPEAAQRDDTSGTAEKPDHTDHAQGSAADGFTMPPEARFSLERLREVVRGLTQDQRGQPRVQRFKGIFNTDRGWRRLEVVEGVFHEADTAYRRDSRAEWIVEADQTHGTESLNEFHGRLRRQLLATLEAGGVGPAGARGAAGSAGRLPGLP